MPGGLCRGAIDTAGDVVALDRVLIKLPKFASQLRRTDDRFYILEFEATARIVANFFGALCSPILANVDDKMGFESSTESPR